MGKLLIKGYADNLFTSNVTTYSVQINPSEFSHNRKSSYKTDDVPGKPFQYVKFNGQDTGDVSFKLFIEGTGAFQASDSSKNGIVVSEEITTIYNALYQFKGEEHSPLYLMISWGTFSFKCVLTSFNVAYKLFRSDGAPLRAEVDLAFKGYVSPPEGEKKANPQSSDLTHLYEVKAGDNLPLICEQYYGKPDYYIQVAKLNGLTNFRRLEPGRQLVLPPLQSS